SIRNYNSICGVKFTTYLSLQVKYEYMNHLRRNRGLRETSYFDGKQEYKNIADDGDFTTSVFVADLVSNLDARTKKIITLRFFHNYTLQEIGLQVSLTGERVRQIIEDGLRQMKSDAVRVNNQ